MNVKSIQNSINTKSISFFSVILLLSPLWLKPLQTNFELFSHLTIHSVFWLGICLAAGVLSRFLLPNSLIQNINSVFTILHRQFKTWYILSLIFIFSALVLINKFILNEFMNSADEHACYFLAECIRNGKFWATPHPLSNFFEVVHIGNINGKWFSTYPPGWPLLWALGLKLNTLHLINPFLSIVSIIFLFKAGKKVFGFSVSLLSLILMTVTPFFLFNNASYFSHTTCLFCVSIFLYAYLKWRENKSIFWAASMALALGYGLGTRYLTMSSIAMPFVVFEAFQLILRRNKLTKSHFTFAGVVFLMVLLNLYYNFIITGNFFDTPSHYYYDWERLGFHSNYTIIHALQFVIKRFFFLMNWIPGIWLFFYSLSLSKNERIKPERALFRYGFLYLVVTYIFYYSWGGNQYGPRYYFEGLPFLTFAISETIVNWWKTGNKPLQKFLIGTLFVSFICNFYLLLLQGSYYNQVSRERKALYEVSDKTINHDAIVFIRGFLGDLLVMSEDDAIRNRPDLDTKILYARDLKEKNELLKQYYPEREYYIGYFDRANKKPVLEKG